MASGTPVVCSATGALPEVAGDSALMLHDDSPESLADALEQVLTDEELRRDLQRNGLARASGFSWSATADRTRQVYRLAAGEAAA